MQVILTKTVRNVGNVGDIVTVKPGFGRNYLLPLNMAVRASKANLVEFEQRRAEFEKAEAELLSQAEARASKMRGTTITISAQAADEGKLYGSINIREVAAALSEAGFEVEKREVNLPQGPVRYLGEYPVKVILHPEVEADLNLSVTQQK